MTADSQKRTVASNYMDNIVNTMMDSLVVVRPDSTIATVNQATLDLLGYREEELLNQHIGIICEEEFANERFAIADVIKKGFISDVEKTYNVEKTYVSRDGRKIPVLFSASVMRDADGRIQGIVCVARDITEYKRMVEALRESEERFRAIFETARDSVFIKDRSLRYTHVNPAMERLFELPASKLIGRTDEDLLGEEAGSASREADSRVLGGETIEEEHTRPVKGVPRTFHVIKVPIRDNSGDIVGLCGISRDITERLEIERQLLQSQKLAALGVMAGGIAHEIRNPLATCSSAAQLLMDKKGSAEFREECAKKIYTNAQRASIIIENLLRVAHPSARTDMERVNLITVLKKTLSLVANQARIQKIELAFHFPEEQEQVWVSGNASLLEHLFVNLLRNGIDAMQEGGVLSLFVERRENEVLVQVVDRGRGISQTEIDKIFDPFYTTMPVGKGTGLGLSICYFIVKQHFGSIEVNSVEGKGSTFTVRLPILGNS